MLSPNHLPEELWMSIFEHFDRKRDHQTINSLRQTNRFFRRLAEPFIYLAVTDYFPKSNPYAATAPVKPLSLQQCVWRIIEKTDVAQHVREIDLQDWHMPIHGRPRPPTTPPPTAPPPTASKPTPDQYLAMLEQTGLPMALREAILEQLSQDTLDGYRLFLLAVCTEIEVLKISGYIPIFQEPMRGVVLHATNAHRESRKGLSKPPSMLKSVKEITLGGQRCVLSYAINLLSLPSLETLRVARISKVAFGVDVDQIPVPAEGEILKRSPIKLVFNNCIVNAAGLAQIIAACASLHSLTVRWRRPMNPDVYSTQSQIAAALREAGSKLEYLHIDTAPFRNNYPPHQPQSFGSFASLTSLRTLAIPRSAFSQPYNAVTDALILPSSLEKLYVLGWDVGMTASAQEIANAGQEWTSALQSQLLNLKKVILLPWNRGSRTVNYTLARELF
jgi:hypothetical protein